MAAKSDKTGVRLESSAHHLAATSSEAWHALSLTEVCSRLHSTLAGGLAQAEAVRRLGLYGANALMVAPGRPPLYIFLAQFNSLLVGLLLAATVIAFARNETIEALAMLIVIVLHAIIGFCIAWRAAQALATLRRQTMPVAQVRRDGIEWRVPAAELVPGDVVVLVAGARVPADGRVLESVRLQVEEAVLTGASVPVNKTPAPLVEANTPLGDRINMAYMGTTVTAGRGLLMVTATGASTEIGKISTLREATATPRTPLEHTLAHLGRALTSIVLGLTAVLVAAGTLRGYSFLSMLEFAIALAIAAAPEGLPGVATLTLALGMQRMARQGALVRRLAAVETLASTTVICTDKTGTLTRNALTVCALVLAGRRIDVTGSGYTPAGASRDQAQKLDARADVHLGLALKIGALCNDAVIGMYGDTLPGDPTEEALVVAAVKARLDHAALQKAYPRLDEAPFDSDTRRMVTVHRTPGGSLVAYMKGAPDAVVAASQRHCTATGLAPFLASDREGVLQANRDLAAAALRVLGLAYRDLPARYTPADLKRDFIFVGLVGLLDPVRREAQSAIATCRRAGIRTIMLTGDQPDTAAEIARQLELDRHIDGTPLHTIHARQLDALDTADWPDVLSHTAVCARLSPRHKLQIVEVLQRQGHIVALTGDGANDAPALQQADIGVAMGSNGTEVARETADMIITDDSFATIVCAVEQGRILYTNMQRFMHYLFSCNIAEIVTVFATLVLGWPLPLVPLQLLWLNITTDVLPALALALEPSTPGSMRQPPRQPRAPLLSWRFTGLIIWQGVLLAAVTLAAFATGLHWYGSEATGLRSAVTMAFMTLALAQVCHVFNARSQRRSLREGLFTNGWLWGAVLSTIVLQLAAVYVPLLQRPLHTVGLSAPQWGVILVCAVLPVLVVEGVKMAQQRRHRAKHH